MIHIQVLTSRPVHVVLLKVVSPCQWLAANNFVTSVILTATQLNAHVHVPKIQTWLLFVKYCVTKLFPLSVVVEFLTIVWMLSTLSLRGQRNHCPCPILRQSGMVTLLPSCLIQVEGHHPQLITPPAQLIASQNQTHGLQTLETSLVVAACTPGEMKMLV